ncbi:MAG: putative thiol-disulfide oxidoreductase [Chlamydiales bacterium]|nr:putative thiol-disulfide oxidoreductase [Chlamydiales bacterium]
MSPDYSKEELLALLKERPILFYDGDCLFCQRALSLIGHQKAFSDLYFAPLKGKTAHMLLDDAHRQADSLVLLEEQSGTLIYSLYSRAILRLLAKRRGLFWLKPLQAFAWAVDPLYRLFARNRRKIAIACPIRPIPPERLLP